MKPRAAARRASVPLALALAMVTGVTVLLCTQAPPLHQHHTDGATDIRHQSSQDMDMRGESAAVVAGHAGAAGNCIERQR